MILSSIRHSHGNWRGVLHLFLMILARLALLPAAAAAATAGLAGLSSFLTTAGDATDAARFLFTASGVVVTSTALRAGAAKGESHGN